MAPDGFPLGVSDVEPGSLHDLTTAWDHVLSVDREPLATQSQRAEARAREGELSDELDEARVVGVGADGLAVAGDVAQRGTGAGAGT